MKILLINPPIREDAKPNCIPIGLGWLASVLRVKHEVEIFDINGLRLDKWSVLKELKCGDYDAYGISGLITTIDYQNMLADNIRHFHPDAFIFSGGGATTSVPEFMSDSIDRKFHKDPINQAAIHFNCKIAWHIDEIPWPAWDLLPMDAYIGNPIWGGDANNSSGMPDHVNVSRSMNMITSVGCPYSCNFCYNQFGRHYYRQRSVSSVLAEVDELMHRYKLNFIGFVDDNMMTNSKWIKEFCGEMHYRWPELRWGCHGRVSAAQNMDLLWDMRCAGCVWIGFGIESGSQTILDLMNKNTTVAKAKQAILNVREANMHPNCTFIYGYPGETEYTIAETRDFKREMGLDKGSFYATPYPGTQLFEQCKDKILEKFSYKEYISRLRNATDFVINLTDIPDMDFFDLKY